MRFILFYILIFTGISSKGQDTTMLPAPVAKDSFPALSAADSARIADSLSFEAGHRNDSLSLVDFADSISKNEFSISYDLIINSGSSKSIAEAYNGGVKTVFIKDDKAKIKFVSLMRNQMILYNISKLVSKKVVVVKSSGKQKYKFYLSEPNWEYFNARYKGLNYIHYNNDSIEVLGKKCARAMAIFDDGSRFTVYYAPYATSEILIKAEPMFEGIPGLPLKLEFDKNGKTVVYLAREISFLPISSKEFLEPVKGFAIKRFKPGTAVTKMVIEDEPIGPDEEE